MVAIAINVGIWALDYYSIKRQYSYYYYNTTTAYPYIDTNTYTDSTSIFTTTDPNDTVGVVVGIAYSWILWKGPITVYALHLSSMHESKGLRFGTWIAEVLVLLAMDILLSIFAKSFYGDWIFFGAYVMLTLIVALVANSGLSRAKETVLNVLVPLLLGGMLYAVYSLLLPRLYYTYTQNLSGFSALFLAFYLYPVWFAGKNY